MDLILCHQTADFDALGAAVGLSCLKKSSHIVLTGGSHPTVKKFLALFQEEFSLREMRTISPEAINSLTIVDTQKKDRLGKASQWFNQEQLKSIEVYDHHAGVDCDIPATLLVNEPLGALTTLITEMLEQEQIKLNPSQATVMALGIHVDTGSLTFATSTPRDAKALAWLMEQGANLNLICQYVTPAFSNQQQQLLSKALNSMTFDEVGGYQIAFLLLPTEHFVEGLSGIAESLMEITYVDALFLVNQYENHLTIIGRSHIVQTNLNLLFTPLGGGGHAQAASVNLHNQQNSQVEEILNQLKQGLIDQLPPLILAKDIMSSPVRTVRPQTTIEQAQHILLRYGHSGLCVVDENNQLVGVISRRNLDLASHHGFTHSPVNGYMLCQPKTISPKSTLAEIENLMIRYDIGRFPVVENQKLVGIVSRKDLIAQILSKQQKQQKKAEVLLVSCLLKDLQKQISPNIWSFLLDAASIASQKGWNLYLVGGGVRDLILSSPNSQLDLQDIDLVVDGMVQGQSIGAALELATLLEVKYPTLRKSVYGTFQATSLTWDNDSQFGSFYVDIATSRTEFYLYPAANPEVEVSSIREDLYRRDFTINALALQLNQPKAGELLDFFAGLEDISHRLVRVLHANSFIEDPTRIFRAVRFAVKLNFKIEAQTKIYIQYAIESGVYRDLRKSKQAIPSLTTRLKEEFKLSLESPYWAKVVKMLGDLNALTCISENLNLDSKLWWNLRYSSRLLKVLDLQKTVPHWLIRLEILLGSIADEAEKIFSANSLVLPKDSINRMENMNKTVLLVQDRLAFLNAPSAIYQFLNRFKFVELLILLPQVSKSNRRKIWIYLINYSKRKSLLSGEDLKELGYRPGPRFKKILEQVFLAALDDQIHSKNEAIQLVKEKFAID
jgi:tRNA nucleotidyltransferase (CCA-adding enzyme)